MAQIKAKIRDAEISVEEICMTVNGHTIMINNSEISIDEYTSLLIHEHSIDVFTSGLQCGHLSIIESKADREVRQTHYRGSCDIHEYRRDP